MGVSSTNEPEDQVLATDDEGARTLWGPALRLLAVLSVFTGLVYPLAITGIAQVLFAHEANGSLVTVDGTARGSALVGQHFEGARYFWGRPSVTAGAPYTPLAAAGSNLGPGHPALLQAVAERVAHLQAAHPEHTGPWPVDLVTASGSGLDPHISPASARLQVARVARARTLESAVVAALLDRHTEGGGLLTGEPRVNVLRLNLALDALGGGQALGHTAQP